MTLGSDLWDASKVPVSRVVYVSYTLWYRSTRYNRPYELVLCGQFPCRSTCLDKILYRVSKACVCVYWDCTQELCPEVFDRSNFCRPRSVRIQTCTLVCLGAWCSIWWIRVRCVYQLASKGLSMWACSLHLRSFFLRSVAFYVECSSDVYFILKVVVIVDVRMFLESVYTIFAYI
jgi:hypothetical protein